MEMDMTQNTNLTQDEMIVEHIGLLKKNGMQDKANDLFETYAYVDMLERKLNEIDRRDNRSQKTVTGDV